MYIDDGVHERRQTGSIDIGDHTLDDICKHNGAVG
jgi:hypothetical protein